MGARVLINGSWYKSFAAMRPRCASSREPNADRVLETYLLASAPGVVLAAVGTDSGFACNAVPVVADLTKWATTFAYEFRDETSPPRPYMNVPPLSGSAQVTRRTCLTCGRARRSPRSHRRRWRWRGSCLASGRTSRPPAIRTARLCRLAALRPTFAPSHRLPDWRTHRRDNRRRVFTRTPPRAVGRARSSEGALVMSKPGSICTTAPQVLRADLRSRGGSKAMTLRAVASVVGLVLLSAAAAQGGTVQVEGGAIIGGCGRRWHRHPLSRRAVRRGAGRGLL